MIEVRYKGRLGNNLFQYALGRILAQELRFALTAPGIPHFVRTLDEVSGQSYSSPVEILGGQQIDFAGVVGNIKSRRIILDGHFQDYRYFIPHEASVKRWFSLPSEPAVRHDLIVHVRRADYIHRGWALPFSYYEKAITTALPSGGRLHIATDDHRDPFFRRFKRWNPQFIRADEITTLTLMARAKALVMSQSSFSWWAAFLAPEPQLVICPAPSFGLWSDRAGFDQVNLVMTDRFTCIACFEPYTPRGRELIYFQVRKLRRKLLRRFSDRPPTSGRV
jgi:hypothetical protein